LAREVYVPHKGYRNESYPVLLADGAMCNLIIYKREPGILQRIRNANRISNAVAVQGLPARRSVTDKIVRLHNDNYELYGALYTYLPGTTIPWEAYTMEHIKQLGAAMSTMHELLRPQPRHTLPLVTDEYRAICRRMETYFGRDGVRMALRNKLGLDPPRVIGRLRAVLEGLSNAPGQQALHMDFVRGNILFSEQQKGRITGILDFEKTAWGHPAFDIARTLAFLLVDCKYKEEGKVRKYFLHSGYNKRGSAQFREWAVLEILLDLFLLYDLYKFLRHNPYEYLQQNEHYIRTRNCLLKRNILTLS
jgi:Ser/Thr protein kinase RdoA (MazF antagonist)